ncbi:MAG: hypothetical protein WCI88_07530 [Chloroflexota bacterium]
MDMQQQMDSFVNTTKLDTYKISKNYPDLLQMHQDILSLIKCTEQICQEHDLSPSRLPDPSKLAYGWLRFLSTEKKNGDLNLEYHLKSLALAYHYLSKAQNEQKISSLRKKLSFHLTFYNTPALFRARQQGMDFFVTFHEGFIHAPPEVIESLVLVVSGNDTATHKAKFRTYALTKAFSENNQVLKFLDNHDNKTAMGRHYNLENIFDRVNHEYFDNMFTQPRLEWSRTHSKRNLGAYRPDSNSLIFSKILDNPKVPEFVLEFVMYHELLHKQMGIKIVNGRSYSHTKKFRSAERQFLRYDEVEKVLRSLVHKH